MTGTHTVAQNPICHLLFQHLIPVFFLLFPSSKQSENHLFIHPFFIWYSLHPSNNNMYIIHPVVLSSIDIFCPSKQHFVIICFNSTFFTWYFLCPNDILSLLGRLYTMINYFHFLGLFELAWMSNLLLLLLLNNSTLAAANRYFWSHLFPERIISKRCIVSSFWRDVAVNINKNRK